MYLNYEHSFIFQNVTQYGFCFKSFSMSHLFYVLSMFMLSFNTVLLFLEHLHIYICVFQVVCFLQIILQGPCSRLSSLPCTLCILPVSSFFNVITPSLFVKNYKILRSLLSNFLNSPVTLSLLSPNILLSIPSPIPSVYVGP
jgi:hypothetical protein